MLWSPYPKGECQRCGFKRNLRDLTKEWTGLRVCRSGCRDPKPEDTKPLRPLRGEGLPRRDAAPETAPVFITPGLNDVTPEDL